jgi:methionyl-tRNA formyltransferase
VRVAFAGTPEFALPALEALARHHELVGVLTQPDRPSGRGRALTASPVKRLALARNLPLAQPASLRDAATLAQIQAWRPQVLVVIAYGLLLPPALLTAAPFGCLNIHASLLPRWRGAAPIQRAILAGDAVTGVSLMRMEAGLDTGPVLLQRSVPIGPRQSAGMLHEELATLGAQILIEGLQGLEHGTLRAKPQGEAGVTYAHKVTKAEALIDWHLSALEIDRQVRAFNPWPVAETLFQGEPLRILQALPVSDSDDGNVSQNESKNHDVGAIIRVQDGILLVRCGLGLLGLKEVQRPGRRPVSAADFANAADLSGARLG